MRIRTYVILLLLLADGVRSAQAQGATTGAIRGEVSAAAGGAPVSGATITAVNTATGLRRSVVTDPGGVTSSPSSRPAPTAWRRADWGWRPPRRGP